MTRDPVDTPTDGRLRQGFVCKRVPHITLKSIAINAETGMIWETYQAKLEPLRDALDGALSEQCKECRFLAS